MTDKEIEKAVDLIKESADGLADEISSVRTECADAMTRIYDIANGSTDDNWRSCMEAITDITREFI